MRVGLCEICGAPLDAAWAELVVTCRYCGAENAPGPAGAPVYPSMPEDGRPRLSLDGRVYVLEGLLARGDSCDVYRARWAMRLSELVVVKVLRASGDGDLLRREAAVLRQLAAAAEPGEAGLARRLPPHVAIGPVRLDEERLVSVFRWQSGFVHTLEQVGEAHQSGVSPGAATWLLKRLLELLGFAHGHGVVHGAVLPPHVLVHPRDHGASLVGWSAATEGSVAGREPLPAVSRAWAALYPEEARASRRVGPATDVAMAARCALGIAGGDVLGRGEPPLPGALGQLVVAAANGAHDDAWDLARAVTEASRKALGPPRYEPIPMPGWPD